MFGMQGVDRDRLRTARDMQDLYLMKSLQDQVRKYWKHAALAGALLALLCPALPPHYRGVCDALATLCSMR